MLEATQKRLAQQQLPMEEHFVRQLFWADGTLACGCTPGINLHLGKDAWTLHTV
jgi:hypothetical protein